TLGLPAGAVASAALGGAVAVEAVLAVGVAARSSVAAYAAAAFVAVASALFALAIARGRRGASCPCIGSTGSVGIAALARNTVLAGGLASLPSVASAPDARATLVGVGAAAACAAVAARRAEAGPPRRVPASGALEVADEGPA